MSQEIAKLDRELKVLGAASMFLGALVLVVFPIVYWYYARLAREPIPREVYPLILGGLRSLAQALPGVALTFHGGGFAILRNVHRRKKIV